MKRRPTVLLVVGMIAGFGPAFADSIRFGETIVVNEANPPIELPFQTTLGRVAICEGPTQGQGCAAGLSDLVIFEVDPKNPNWTLVTMCSDKESCKVPFNSTGAAVFLAEDPNEHIEKIRYVASEGLPGAVSGLSLTYRFISDTPEPSSVLLLGTGLVALVPIFRRKLRM